MRLYMPKSFFALLLTGFLFISLPLLTALYSAMQSLDRLMLQSNQTVHNSVLMTTTSRKLADLLLDEERKARVFSVLSEPAQLQAVNSAHEDIIRSLNTLEYLTEDGQLQQLIKELKSHENHIVETLNRHDSNSIQDKKNREQILDRYQEIAGLSVDIVKLSNQMMTRGVDELRQKFSQDKEKLIWQTSGLLSFTVLLIIVFMALISRPIRQIHNSIEHLGDGNFNKPIDVSGPKDLQDLGKKLDWLRKRLTKMEQEKNKLVAHISHDLKTPLTSIKEGVSLLRDELIRPMDEDQKRVVDILDKNCAKLQKLIENIVDFNMAQAKKVPSEKSRVKLNELIDEVVSEHRNSIIARNIKLTVQLDVLTILGDPKQLKSVFDNLLSNAVKFTSDGGFIRLKLKKAGALALCSIDDSGPGISEEYRSQIFSPFFQGKVSGKAVIKGSGLGLAISKEYIKNHGGTIRLLDSKKGARFQVTLPISA